MKYLLFLITTLSSGLLMAQRPSIKFEATTPRLAKVGEVIQLRAILSGKSLPEDLKWKIGGEEGKDWKFTEGSKNTDKEISVVFKKIGPTNVSLSAKAIVDSTLKGKKTPEQVKKIVETFLKVYPSHKFPVLDIKYNLSETYDGKYPSFTIIYQHESKREVDDILGELTKSIENYTTMKHKQDYWLGLSWTWSL